MKLILCKDCKHFHSIDGVGCGMCYCGHCFYRVLSTVIKKINNKDVKIIRKVMVYGPCTVWYLSDKEMYSLREGGECKLRWVREPHENIKRVDKGTILFLDQPGMKEKYIE